MAQSTFSMIDSTGQNWQLTVNSDGDIVATPVSFTGTTPGVVPAGTYTPQNAIDLATALNHKAPTSTIQAQVCDMIQSRIWTTFPWSWTVASLTAVSLTDGVQDYAHLQSDFYRFVNLEINQTSTTPNVVRPLNQKNHLSVELVSKAGIETIRNFSWEPDIAKIRLDYPAAIPSGTTIVIQGTYQRLPVKITSGNLTTVLNLPDEYFQVFLEGVRWKFYELTDDPRAGSCQEVGGRTVFTGQQGTFITALDAMKRAEDFSDGEDVVFPSGGTLGIGKDSFTPRIFG